MLAFLVLAAAEAFARILASAGLIEPDPTLDGLIATHTETLTESPDGPPSTWLLGNSTLARGIQESRLEEVIGNRVAKLSHGSANFRALTELLDYYTEVAGAPPRRVLLLTTVDDFNLRGRRASESERYLDYRPSLRLSPLEWSVLVQARGDIGERILRPIHALAGRRDSSRIQSEEARVDSEFVRSLARRFKFDHAAFDRLGEVVAARGIARAEVALLPVSGRYREIRDAASPDWPTERVRHEVIEECRTHELEFLDFSDLLLEERYFEDGFHAAAIGAAILTERMTEVLAGG